MVDVHNLEYSSWQTVYFQRATVIVTELLLVYSLQRYSLISAPIMYKSFMATDL